MSPYPAGAIIASDTGLFRKHGLDVTMIFITVVDEYAKRTPKAKTMKPEEFIDFELREKTRGRKVLRPAVQKVDYRRMKWIPLA
jgi:hypothetical protein